MHDVDHPALGHHHPADRLGDVLVVVDYKDAHATFTALFS